MIASLACYLCLSNHISWRSINWYILVYRNYWRDPDTALFILKHLYRDIPEDPNTPQDDMKNQTSSKGWHDQRDVIEEELPLTFSDKSMVRSFSSKARKLWKKGWKLTQWAKLFWRSQVSWIKMQFTAGFKVILIKIRHTYWELKLNLLWQLTRK